MTECEEIADNMSAYPVTFDEALAIVRVRMPDESATVRANVAEALLARVLRELHAAERDEASSL